MPSSDPSNISLVMDLVIARRNQVNSVLDVGIGCGKYGMLFREYLDGHWNGRAFHDKSTWKVRIDGIEIFPDYIVSRFHTYLYDAIYTTSLEKFLETFKPTYDLIMMGDIIEHFPKEKGEQILEQLMNSYLNPSGMIILSTPNFDTNISGHGPAPFGNVHERHCCRWTEADFKSLPYNVEVYSGKLLTVTLR